MIACDQDAMFIAWSGGLTTGLVILAIFAWARKAQK